MIFAHFLKNAHVPCDTSKYLYAQIAYNRFHIRMAFQSCAECEYTGHVYVSCDSSKYLYAQIVCYIYHIGKAFLLSVLSQYALIAMSYHETFYHHTPEDYICTLIYQCAQ